jgi:hypothetical protein
MLTTLIFLPILCALLVALFLYWDDQKDQPRKP